LIDLNATVKVLLSLTSPLLQTVVSGNTLKAPNAKAVFQRQDTWSNVKTPGKTTVKAKTSNYTFRLKAKNCPFASNAGAK